MPKRANYQKSNNPDFKNFLYSLILAPQFLRVFAIGVSLSYNTAIEKWGGVMNYQIISYFVKAAEVLNFSEAARQLYIAPQSFGKQIALLEEEMGEKLFERTTREMKLTAFGKECYERFSGPVRALERNFIQMCELGNGRKGIRIGIFSALSRQNVVSPIVGAILAHYEDKDINISMMGMGELQTAVQNNKIDLGITVTHDREAGWRNCSIYPIAYYPAQIAVSKNHRWFEKDSVSPTEFESSNFVRMDLPQYSEMDYFANIPCKRVIVVENYETMNLEVDSGRAFAIMSSKIDEMHDRGYKFFDLPCNPFDYTLALICKNDAENEFLEEVCSVIQCAFEA